MVERRDHSFLLRIFVTIFLAVAAMLAGYTVHSVSAEMPSPPSPLPPAPGTGTPIPTQRDVVYCTAGGVPLKMDIYMPASAGGVPLKMDIYMPASAGREPLPAAMFVHGGAWSAGDKASAQGAPEVAELAGRGYLVASIDYRLYPWHVFPSQIQDVKCAVRYLRANAASLGIDPERIGAWGDSAGGHLVSLLGTADESAGFEGTGGYPGISSRVQAVVDMYGRADLTEIPRTRPDLLPIFGGEENLVKYSPVTYVSKDDPPFLILHGDHDTTVPPELSREFYNRLTAAGVPAALVIVKNAGHGFAPTGPGMSPSRHEIARMVGDFFDRYLKASPAPANDTGSPVDVPALPSGGDSVKFAATGEVVRSIFLDYWKTHGGLAQQGYPISGELQELSSTDGKPYTVQYFERALLEYHPGHAAPYDVMPALLGAQRYKARYPAGAPGQHANDTEGSLLFQQTGHRLGGVFLRYWQQHGGVIEQGYPISDEFSEISPMDGKPYTVQYFERALFEYHPKNDEPNQVLLAQLGTFKYKSKYSSSGPANRTPPAHH